MIPDSVEIIGDNAFSGCSKLESVTFGSGVTIIRGYAFQKCTALETIVIPDSVTTIGAGLFYSCTALETIVIPDSVTTIGANAFAWCSSLVSITFEGEGLSVEDFAFASPNPQDLLTDVYRYDVTLNIDSQSFGRVLTYHQIYRIQYMDGADMLGKQYLLPGDVPSFEGTPEKEGYTFMRFLAMPENMPAEDVTAYVAWTINQYTITFDTAGGSAIPAMTKFYGSEIVLPANPTRGGYIFAGWSRAIPETMPAEDITVTALWTEAEPAPSDSGSDMLLYAGIAAAAAALVIAAVFIRRR